MAEGVTQFFVHGRDEELPEGAGSLVGAVVGGADVHNGRKGGVQQGILWNGGMEMVCGDVFEALGLASLLLLLLIYNLFLLVEDLFVLPVGSDEHHGGEYEDDAAPDSAITESKGVGSWAFTVIFLLIVFLITAITVFVGIIVLIIVIFLRNSFIVIVFIVRNTVIVIVSIFIIRSSIIVIVLMIRDAIVIKIIIFNTIIWIDLIRNAIT